MDDKHKLSRIQKSKKNYNVYLAQISEISMVIGFPQR